MEPKEPKIVECPICGRELNWNDDIFTEEYGDNIAGCSQCLHRHNALEWFDIEYEEAI